MDTAAANDMPQCERCYQAPALGYHVPMCQRCLDRATRKLSTAQRSLLDRAAAEATGSIPLEQDEIPAAMGLQARGLAVTRRNGKTSSILAARPRYRKGSRRWMHLTQAGLTYRNAQTKKTQQEVGDTMDPSAALNRFLEALHDADEAKVGTDERSDALSEAADAWRDLVGWHSKGGFLPQWPDVDLGGDDNETPLIFHLGRLSMTLDLQHRDGYWKALQEIGGVLEDIEG